MNFAQLKAFQAVAKNGSITRAAQILHISQPAVSKHLKILEEDYGVKLFERNAGTAEPTDAESCLLRHVNAILVHLDEAKKELKSPKNLTKSDPLKVAGELRRISAPSSVVARQFQKQAPRHFHDTANRREK